MPVDRIAAKTFGQKNSGRAVTFVSFAGHTAKQTATPTYQTLSPNDFSAGI
jgi:hypothetical protein